MPVSLNLSAGTLYGFLLVLARVAGALSFVPIPGANALPQSARIALSGAVAVALFARWPAVDAAVVSPGRLLTWVAAEAVVGLAIGLTVAVVLEAFILAAQVLGLQAGYAYASTIDPNTEADSGVLLVFAQLLSGMLFFAAGLDREVLRLFALSLETIPAGAYAFGRGSAQTLSTLASHLFSVGLRLAMPVVALLLMLDIALALLGRLNQQLQLLSLAFPAKMLTALLALTWVASIFSRVLLEFSGLAFSTARRVLHP